MTAMALLTRQHPEAHQWQPADPAGDIFDCDTHTAVRLFNQGSQRLRFSIPTRGDGDDADYWIDPGSPAEVRPVENMTANGQARVVYPDGVDGLLVAVVTRDLTQRPGVVNIVPDSVRQDHGMGEAG